MLQSVPGTNQYYSIRIRFHAKKKTGAFDGVQTQT